MTELDDIGIKDELTGGNELATKELDGKNELEGAGTTDDSDGAGAKDELPAMMEFDGRTELDGAGTTDDPEGMGAREELPAMIELDGKNELDGAAADDPEGIGAREELPAMIELDGKNELDGLPADELGGAGANDELDGFGATDELMAPDELMDGATLELFGTLDKLAEAELLAGELAEKLAEPLTDPPLSPRVPSGAFGSAGEYVVNIDVRLQAAALEVEVIVVPESEHPVSVLKLYGHTRGQPSPQERPFEISHLPTCCKARGRSRRRSRP